MRMLAYILALLCIVAAVVYFAIPAGKLPPFMPGYEVGSAHIHMRRAIVAVVAAVVIFLIGWFAGRSRHMA
jgi:hypothetical protein